MGDCAGIVRLEGAHDLEGLRHDTDNAICTAKEDAFRTGDYARDVSDLAGVRRFVYVLE